MSVKNSQSFDTSFSADPIEGRIVELSDLKITIRRLKPEHAAELVRFNDNLGEESRRLFLPHAYDPATIVTYIRRNADGKDISYVGVNETGQIVAYFFLWEIENDVPLLGIGITDSCQNRGLGHVLMNILRESAVRLDRSGIDLTTMLDNERAFHLYQSCGYTLIGEVPNLTGNGKIVTERRLFLPLKPDAVPPDRTFGPPDEID